MLAANPDGERPVGVTATAAGEIYIIDVSEFCEEPVGEPDVSPLLFTPLRNIENWHGSW